MCGIVAVSGNARASDKAALGLYPLQHRGQEAFGIAANDGSKTRVYKSPGQVSSFLDKPIGERPELPPGTVALGHTRYSTAGTQSLENAQPLYSKIAVGGIECEVVLVHNGNITNAGIIRQELAGEGISFQGDSDSEVILHLIARSKEPGLEDRIRGALAKLTGAFSVIIMVNDDLYVARDPWGYRPLVWGRNNGSVFVASETCALDLVEAQDFREIGAGEMWKIRGGHIEQLDGLQRATPLQQCVFEQIYFARPDSTVFGVVVDRFRRALGRQLACEHPVAGAEVVIAVPDSANSAALGYSEVTGIPYELALIRNHYAGRTFIDPTQAGRNFKAKVKFNPVKALVEGKSVVMVDDSIVRGTTSRGLVTLVRSAGAREVHFLSASPMIVDPCYFGIDTPDTVELIASGKTLEQIRDEIGANSVSYLSLGGLERVMAELAAGGGFCTSCFSGIYRVALPDREAGLALRG